MRVNADGLAEQILRMPVRINFAGFESLLPNLLNNGWASSIQTIQEMARDSITYRIALKHKVASLSGVAECVVDREQLYSLSNGSNYRNVAEMFMFGVRYMASELHVMTVSMPSNFIQSPFKPMVSGMMDVATSSKRHRLEDIVRFETVEDSKDIFIPEKSIEDLMGMILTKQEDVQVDIRNRILNDKQRARNGESVIWTPKEHKTNLIVVSA